MKFIGEPNMFVRIANKNVHRLTNCKGFYFNELGIYETENDILIKFLSQIFESAKEENDDNETATEIKDEDIKESKKVICRQCGEEFTNMGQMLAHARKNHPKGGK